MPKFPEFNGGAVGKFIVSSVLIFLVSGYPVPILGIEEFGIEENRTVTTVARYEYRRARLQILFPLVRVP